MDFGISPLTDRILKYSNREYSLAIEKIRLYHFWFTNTLERRIIAGPRGDAYVFPVLLIINPIE